jgi:hypothetical protein
MRTLEPNRPSGLRLPRFFRTRFWHVGYRPLHSQKKSAFENRVDRPRQQAPNAGTRIPAGTVKYQSPSAYSAASIGIGLKSRGLVELDYDPRPAAPATGCINPFTVQRNVAFEPRRLEWTKSTCCLIASVLGRTVLAHDVGVLELFSFILGSWVSGRGSSGCPSPQPSPHASAEHGERGFAWRRLSSAWGQSR